MTLFKQTKPFSVAVLSVAALTGLCFSNLARAQSSVSDEPEFSFDKSKCMDVSPRDQNQSRSAQKDQDCFFKYFYLSGFIGAGFGDNDIDVQSAASDIGFEAFDIEEDYDGLALKLMLGASFTENLSIELGYTRLADAEIAFSANTTNPELFFDLARTVRPTSVDGFTGALVYSFLTEDEYYLYARVGLFVWEGEYDSFDVFAARQLESLPSTDGTDLFFGIGATYRINDNFEANLEWERYRFDKHDDDVVWLGLTYHFDDAKDD